MKRAKSKVGSKGAEDVICQILGVGHLVITSRIVDPLELAKHAYTCLTGEIVQEPAHQVFTVVMHKPGKVMVACIKTGAALSRKTLEPQP